MLLLFYCRPLGILYKWFWQLEVNKFEAEVCNLLEINIWFKSSSFLGMMQAKILTLLATIQERSGNLDEGMKVFFSDQVGFVGVQLVIRSI